MGKVLSAQGSGYYPICIETGERPDDQDYLDLSIEEGMALYWRTKKWRIDASGTFISNNFGQPVVFSGGGEITLRTIIESEEKLVCSGYKAFGGNGNNIVANSSSQSYDIYWRFPDGYKTETKFYPYFIFTSPYIQSYNVREDQKVGTLRFLFNGYTITKNLYTDTAEYPYTGTSGNVQISFTCTEYWPYGGTYDTTTGQPL
jgi:hypothetical protein